MGSVMTEIIKPIPHDDNDAFIKLLIVRAKLEEDTLNEETAFLLRAAAEKIEMWRDRCEAVQADLDGTMKDFLKYGTGQP